MTNPYVALIATYINEILGWGKYLSPTIGALVVLLNGVKYQQGDTTEKVEAAKNIKKTFYVAGGIFFALWFVQTIAESFAKVKV